MGDWARTGLVAVPNEIRPLLGALEEAQQERWGETILHSGTIAGHPAALATVLPGPVNGALGAQALIARYDVRRLIGFGSAGALDPQLSPGDVVVAKRAVAHDSGTFLGHHFEPSGVMGRDEEGQIGYRRDFEADPVLVAEALASAHSLSNRVYTGTVVTGNQVIFSTARKRWLHHTFNAHVVEMETAAVAQVAVAHGLPWVAVRAVSDSAGDDCILDFSRLRVYLDDDQPAWRRQLDQWWYLLTHPTQRRRLSQLDKGLTLASEQAARAVEAMLRA